MDPQISLDSLSKGQLRRGAAHAGSAPANPHHALWGQVQELDIAAICLDHGPNRVDDAGNVTKRARLGLGRKGRGFGSTWATGHTGKSSPTKGGAGRVDPNGL